LNFDDDILQTPPGAETSRRVQIQYRIRVVDDISLDANPLGMDHVNVLAFGATGGDVVGYPFLNMGSVGSVGDNGLWRTGGGDPTSHISSEYIGV